LGDPGKNESNLYAAAGNKNHKIALYIINGSRSWKEDHRNEKEALQIFYVQPNQRRDLTFRMVRELSEELIAYKPSLPPLHIRRVYVELKKSNGSPNDEITDLVSLIRRIAWMNDFSAV
jgi:type I restriction enzyme R subunit